jgi:N-acetylglutamate synthase-like GNAT family acetyltransferase
MTVAVRRFDARDQASCRRIILSGLADHFGFIDESRNPDLDNIEKSYLAKGNEFYVAEEDGELAGTAGLLFEPGRARIVRMSVAQGHRRKGVATALLSRCIAAARVSGVPEVVAFTEPHWHDAVGFYLSSGFKQFGKDDEDIHLTLKLSD